MGKSGAVYCGVTDPFSWVLSHTSFCLSPARVCFPHPVKVLMVLWWSEWLPPSRGLMPYPSLLHPEPPWQATADLHLHRKHSNIVLAQSLWWSLGPDVHKVSLSPPNIFGRYRVWVSTWFCPSYHLSGAPPLPLDVRYLFWWDPTFSCQWLFSSELQFWSSCRSSD